MHFQHIDPSVLLDTVGDDKAAYCGLLRIFMDIAPAAHVDLQQALQHGDCAVIARTSHALKGSVMLVGAEGLTALLQTIEVQARQEQEDGLLALAPVLAKRFDQVLEEVLVSLADSSAE